MPVRGMEDCSGFTYWGVNQETGERFSLDDIAQVRVVEGEQYEFTQPVVAEDGETISDVIERVAADPNHVVTIIGEDGNPREVVGHEVVYHRDGAVDIDGHPILTDIHIPTELTAEDIDGIPQTAHTNTSAIISGYCQNEWCLPDHADIGSIWETENPRTRWEWTGTQWQPAGGIVEDEEQVAHMEGYDAAANEEPAPVLEVGDYIYNGVPNPVDYNAIEDAMRAVPEATVRGQRARQLLIDDPIYPNVDLEALNDTIARDGDITIEPRLRADPMTQEDIEEIARAIRHGMRFTIGADFAHDSAAVDNDDTTDTTEGQFADIFEVAT